MKTDRLALVLFGTLGAIIASLPARAQTVDYGSMESLFGEPITSSATGTAQRANDVAANMTIITADDIRRSGSRSIAEIIGERVPGIDLLRTSNTTYDVGVRGYQQPFQPRLLVLVDGRQVFVDDYSRTIWDNIPVNIDDIRQIEVVKGANSALFGSNAAGGVIDIVTYNPLFDNNNVAAISGGTQSSIMDDATVTVKLGDWGGIKISGGTLDEDQFTTGMPAGEQGIRQNPSHRYATESSLFRASPNFLANTELTYSYSTSDGAIPEYGINRNATTTYSLGGGFAWKTDYGTIHEDTYLNHSTVNTLNAIGSDRIVLTTNLLVSHLEDQFTVGDNHTFRTAIEYRYKTFDPLTASTPGNPNNPYFNQSNYSASGIWLWQINDKLSWTNAARVDHLEEQQTGTLFPNAFFTNADYSHDINTYSLNSGLVYHATDLDTFRALYGRGVQIPSFLESSFSATLANSGVIVDLEGDPRLKPTIVQSYELDYDRGIPEIFSTSKFALFYQLNQDVVSPVVTGPVRIIGGVPYVLENDMNVGNSRGWGVEVELSGSHPAGFRWDASYSFDKVYDSGGVSSTLDYAGSAPEHHFRLSLGYTTGPWEFDANGQYVTSSNMLRSLDGGSTEAPAPTDGYASLNGRIGYKITDQFTIAASGTNLNRRITGESPYPAIERQAFLTLTGKF